KATLTVDTSPSTAYM
nr:immunoglobulin heavy chain junction region [Mus musculus]